MSYWLRCTGTCMHTSSIIISLPHSPQSGSIIAISYRFVLTLTCVCLFLGLTYLSLLRSLIQCRYARRLNAPESQLKFSTWCSKQVSTASEAIPILSIPPATLLYAPVSNSRSFFCRTCSCINRLNRTVPLHSIHTGIRILRHSLDHRAWLSCRSGQMYAEQSLHYFRHWWFPL